MRLGLRPLWGVLCLCISLNVSAQTAVDSVTIAVQGGDPPIITSNTTGTVATTLQFSGTVFPLTVSQAIVWTVTGGGTAAGSIDAVGLLTVPAQTSGYLWVKGTSAADPSRSDSVRVLVYCRPSHTNPLNWFVIDTVSIPGTTLYNGSATLGNPGAYTLFPATGSSTTTLTKGSGYSVKTQVTSPPGPFAPDTALYTYSVSAWIDYNANGIFEPSEWLDVEDSALNRFASYNFTVPATAAEGTVLMRVRSRLQGGSNGVSDMCLGYTGSGQTEDYIVTIVGQALPVDSVTVSVLNSAPSVITTNAGTLQMVASVFPVTVSQNVTWTIVPGTGAASISSSGLVTAQTDGTIWAKAVSVLDAAKSDSLLITISGQIVPVDSVTIATQGSVAPSITVSAGTLQMVGTVYPLNASQSVSWSVVPVSGNATVSSGGLITAVADGTVWAKVTSVQDPSKSDSLLITISGQIAAIDSVVVKTQGNIPAVISTQNGTLQLEAWVYPASASQAVTWSVIPLTGNATVSSTGLVTAPSDGTVWAKAVSVQNVTYADSLLITISGQATGVEKMSSGYGLQVYPNPAGQYMFIRAAHRHAALTLTVYTMSGQRIGKWNIGDDALTSPFRLPVGSLAPGVYLLRFDNDEMQESLMVEIE